MKKTGFNGYVYDFSADHDATDVDHIKDIHKYLLKKNNIVQMKIFRFVKKVFFIGLHNFHKCNSVELYFNEKSRM